MRAKTPIELDRLSRRQRDGVNVRADWFERGMRVVVVTQQLDLDGAVGRLVASMLFGLAEIEVEYRRERQAAGIAVAKRKGVYRGRQRGTPKAQPARAQALGLSWGPPSATSRQPPQSPCRTAGEQDGHGTKNSPGTRGGC
ncbi:MAG TPA: recombinase family protein [Candidatus Tectomicrobia bacterium]|nr:recombinase family protein [Candidatus Tectomicrobia bacterium]